MTAIQQVASHLLENATVNKNIAIFCDSQAAIHSLIATKQRSKTVITTTKALNKLGLTNVVNVHWVPAHAGHPGNERADTLAKLGASPDNNLNQEIIVLKPPVPHQLWKRAIDDLFRQEWENTWTREGPRHSKLAWNEGYRKGFNKLNKKDTRSFTQIITGHAGLNYHLHKMKLTPTPLCERCGYAPETVSHYLGQCPAFNQIRGEIFNVFYCSLTDIKETQSVGTIIKYINKTKRLIFKPKVPVDQSNNNTPIIDIHPHASQNT